MELTWNWTMEQKSLEPMKHIKICQLRWEKLDFPQVELELSACMPVFMNTCFNKESKSRFPRLIASSGSQPSRQPQ